ncbi:Ribosomal RNA small subunit methyltransferase NEP1 [Sesamum angolense]|uniref:Ribosomal RNA small subunit methyltransferase NEP1 n=1 Tax=Sesamum angolense TaxID=2727404 RepID=A0AAE1WG07_9LAMI|nr:Ribosomal RNA small subunit methyltransferase NEP1 [Sesamum angolense]
MGRAYKMKGQKRKKKEEKYDKEEEFEQLDEKEDPPSPKKVKTEGSESEKVEEMEPVIDEMPGIPIVPVDTGSKKPGTYQLLSSDEHANYLTKNKRNPADYRPDIAFQNNKAELNSMFFKVDFIALQALALGSPSVDFLMSIPYFILIRQFKILDSRVNKSGRLKALYVRTQQGLLLEIKPHARMPRTYKRFSGLMVQLLQKLHITAAGFSHSSEKLVDMYNYVGAINNDLDLVFVVGAMSHGKIEDEYVEDYLSMNLTYPLMPMHARSCPPALVHPPSDYPSVPDSTTPPAAGYAYDLKALKGISQD